MPKKPPAPKGLNKPAADELLRLIRSYTDAAISEAGLAGTPLGRPRARGRTRPRRSAASALRRETPGGLLMALRCKPGDLVVVVVEIHSGPASPAASSP